MSRADDDVVQPIELEISGVTVQFPCTPYESQINMMESVINGCRNGQHCLLESPTGSGKTLALLCGVLAWQKANTEEPRKIYYVTRTHGQIKQVVDQLKSTAYWKTKMSILESKKRTCIQDQEEDKDKLCHRLRNSNSGCMFYNNKERINTHEALEFHGIEGSWDIEDLGNLGRQHDACPYYAALNLAETSKIVFCTYNYMLNPILRESMGNDLQGAILIFDEAHNIEASCRENGSISVSINELLIVRQEFSNVPTEASRVPIYREIEDYCNRFINFINEFRDLQMMGQELVDKLNVSNLLSDERCINGLAENGTSFETKRLVSTLIFARQMIQEYGLDYGAAVIIPIQQDERAPRLPVFHLFCLNPAVTFKPLSNIVRNVILASSSFYSSEYLLTELDTEFSVIRHLEWTEFDAENRLFVSKLSRGPGGILLDASRSNASFDEDLRITLGLILFDICNIVPHGILCFFPSYPMMGMLIDTWTSFYRGDSPKTLWNEMRDLKMIYRETPNCDPNDLMDEYRASLEEISMEYQCEDDGKSALFPDRNGAMICAVHRGKVSEGINFPDNEARAVVCMGVPLATLSHPGVAMKRRYNDLKNAPNYPSGETWYRINAVNVLNQSLGRCIRHMNDWGSIILVDNRFTEETRYGSYDEYLPNWVRSVGLNESNYELFKFHLDSFISLQSEPDDSNN